MTKPKHEDVLGDSLIPVINRLQDIFSQVTVELKLGLPQVAVVGSQSSGKSSVLEALVGRDFLPRGPDICTRRPLVLQLIKTPAAPAAAPPGQPSEWGEFLHAPGKVFHDFDRIRAEIQSETERVSGGNKNISDKPIRLKIFSPNVLTMTLIDLPGITKVPVGDQPSNIEQRIREMVLQYIREPSCIILAVSAANTDLANSDALQMAQLVDAEGARTIGVLTKLDIMDRGTNALPALRNLVVPLRLGYVAVVNRSQADINTNKSMRDARSAEQMWFESHSEYSEVTKQCGVGNLAKRINVILGNHIRLMLPTLRRQINEALEAKSAELKSYGPALDLDSESARGAALLQLLCGYAERFGALLQGHSEDMPLSELMGGARIRHIFQEVFARQLRQLDPFRELGDEDVRTAIKNSSGVAGTLLIPQEPFELLVRRSIGRLMSPSLSCKSGAEPAEKMIRELVACEHEYINTDHPDFIGGTRAVKVQAVMEGREARKAAAAEGAQEGSRPDGSSSHSGGSWFGWLTKSDSSRERAAGREGGLTDVARSNESKPRNEHEEVQVEVIRLLVSNYFDIVRSNLADLVPKALMRFLVHHSQRGLQQHLIATLYRDSLAGELLQERDDVARSRARAQAAVEALQAANATLEDVPSELATTMASVQVRWHFRRIRVGRVWRCARVLACVRICVGRPMRISLHHLMCFEPGGVRRS
ncbi:P-loop containing nucleoside triphosphate hydrolase protein [Scenedesmus sp. NREL 46B-D3]|nr:P-loop containing nucleoside triphosphate hydrolase protein [Scenedesmus sp. NREL 46B-D3]